MTRRLFPFVTLFVTLILLLIPVLGRLQPTEAQSGGTTTRVSVASDSTEGNGYSGHPSISADGRFVAFYSGATNLVSGDTNDHWDVFVHDRQTGQTTRVSVASDGTEGNGFSGLPSISDDGRYVAFYSHADNLVSSDTNSKTDVFVHDRETGQTTRVSVASDGSQGASTYVWGALDPSISADGRYVAFYSFFNNLVSGDTNDFCDVDHDGYYQEECPDIFVHDRQTSQTTRVSVASDGSEGWGESYWASISADGRYVAFHSGATNLVSNDTNGTWDAFVHDRDIGQTTRISEASDGTEGNNASGHPSISADGRYVTFYSIASNLVSGDTNVYCDTDEDGQYDDNCTDIFVHDRQTSQTTRVSVGSAGAEGNNGTGYVSDISGDGRYVTFRSEASNLVTGDTNDAWDVFVHDRQAAQTIRVSVASDGSQGNGDSYARSISADGLHVGLTSDASNLVSGDTNNYCDNDDDGQYDDNCRDAFVHDLGGQGTGPEITYIRESADPIYRQGCPEPTTVTIRADVTDETGLDWVLLYYVPPGGSSLVNELMTLESGDTYAATVGPFSEVGMLDYYVRARDNEGNEVRSSSLTVTINDCDSISPTITNISESADPINLQCCPEPTVVAIRADVTDNLGVNQVLLQYVPPGGSSLSQETMSLESGDTFVANVGPFDQAGTLQYYVEALDTAGNGSQSSLLTVTSANCDTTCTSTIEFVDLIPTQQYRLIAPTNSVDVDIFAKDCCERDDVVEIYVDGCLVGSVDSRDGEWGTHSGITHTVSVGPGMHSVEYRSVTSGDAPSGWIVSETYKPFSGNFVCGDCSDPTGASPAFEPITDFGKCPSDSLLQPPYGLKDPTWGSFGKTSNKVLVAKSGEKLELRCEEALNAFVLYYTSPTGARQPAGMCPFEQGCNSAYFWHVDTDKDDDQPDCFVKTRWISRDYGENDEDPNPWAWPYVESQPLLDWADSILSMSGQRLVRFDHKFDYSVDPPLPDGTCSSGAEGAWMLSRHAIPPAWPEADSSLAKFSEGYQALSLDLDVREECPIVPCDLDRNGTCNSADEDIFALAFGTCRGEPDHKMSADIDGDGCVVTLDQAFFSSAYVREGRIHLPVVLRNHVPDANLSPTMPSSPSPEDAATSQSLDVNLSWLSGDPDGDSVTYDVYLEAGDSTPDVLVCNDASSASCDPGTLDSATHYYWQVVARDEHGASTTGPVWDFVTTQTSPGWYVSTIGDDSNDCQSPATACKTIQAAIEKASAGDTIYVAEGTYYENIVLKEDIKLLGAGPHLSTIAAHKLGWEQPGVVTGAEGAMVAGFTIANDGLGDSYGYRATPFLSMTFHNNVFVGHYVGVHAGQYSSLNLFNNVFTGNTTGITFGWANAPVIRNNIVVGNSKGIHWYDDGTGGSPQADIDYNDVWNNTEYDYDIQPGPNDISVDPLFVNAATGDYHLSSCSPAIDVGDPTFDYAKEPEPNGNRINMGAYGNTDEATPSSCP